MKDFRLCSFQAVFCSIILFSFTTLLFCEKEFLYTHGSQSYQLRCDDAGHIVSIERLSDHKLISGDLDAFAESMFIKDMQVALQNLSGSNFVSSGSYRSVTPQQQDEFFYGSYDDHNDSNFDNGHKFHGKLLPAAQLGYGANDLQRLQQAEHDAYAQKFYDRLLTAYLSSPQYLFDLVEVQERKQEAERKKQEAKDCEIKEHLQNFGVSYEFLWGCDTMFGLYQNRDFAAVENWIIQYKV